MARALRPSQRAAGAPMAVPLQRRELFQDSVLEESFDRADGVPVFKARIPAPRPPARTRALSRAHSQARP